MQIKTNVKAGGTYLNHNETTVTSKKLTVKTGVKAGGIGTSPSGPANHNEKLVCLRRKAIVVKTSVKAGGTFLNHNETLI